jgi:hypothetical protein
MLRDFISRKALATIFFISLILILGSGIWAFYSLRDIEEPLILHYSQYSISQTGSIWDLLSASLFGVVVVGINFAITLKLIEKDLFLSRLIAFATLIFGILISMAFVAIIGVNT